MSKTIVKWIILLAVGLFFAWMIFLTIGDMSGKIEHSDAATVTIILAISGVSSILKWLKEHS